jgi:hypothetical protein
MTNDKLAVHPLAVNTILGLLVRRQPTLRADALAILRDLKTDANYAGAQEQIIIDKAIQAVESL